MEYLKKAPLPLALERTWECHILNQYPFNAPVLDLGCGDGIFTNILFKDNLEYALDPQSQEIEACKKFQRYTSYLQNFGDKIPIDSATINTVVSNSVLEHIPDLVPVLKEVNRILANNGRFYITVPTNYFDKYSVIYQILSILNLNSLAEKYRIFFNNFWKHYHYYSVENWKKIFTDNDFNVIEYKQYCTLAQGVLNDFLVPFTIISYLQKKILSSLNDIMLYINR